MLNLIIIFSLLLLRVEPETAVLHSGFLPSDPRQEIVQEAYLMWGIDFLALLECKNGNWDTETLWDGGRSHWLCQLNQRRHKEAIRPDFSDRKVQLSVCYQKRKAGTKFYGPQRLIWGKRCSEVAKKRFYFFVDCRNEMICINKIWFRCEIPR